MIKMCKCYATISEIQELITLSMSKLIPRKEPLLTARNSGLQPSTFIAHHAS